MALKQVTVMPLLIDALDLYRTTYLQGAILHCYSNNYIPLLTSVLGNFTESTFPGYVAITLSAWGAVFDNGASQAETDHPQQTFTCTGGGGETLYGIYVTKGGALVYAQRNDPADLPVPLNMVLGQNFLYTPKMFLQNIT